MSHRSAPRRQPPVVETEQGSVRGHAAGGVLAFHGLPYAAPPVGPDRWRAPGRAAPWPGIRNATAPGPIAPQAPSPFDEMLFPGRGMAQDEDCLTLNLWTPSPVGRRPVMVWVHGGGFTLGAGSQPLYDGRRLAQAGDVVVVTLNYRLGALGFLRLDGVTGGRLPATGNEGLLDVVAALRWVREHAALFGGDPGNITLFGESAGGMIAGTLLAMPAARGLFHRAVLQSGAAHVAAGAAAADRVAERFLALAGVRADDPAGLQALPSWRLLAAQQALLAESPRTGLGYLPFRPVVDGSLVPVPPIAAVRDGAADGIPMLAGTTADEWTLFANLNPLHGTLDERGLRRRLGHLFRDDEIDALLPLYSDHLAARGIEPTPAEQLTAILGDAWFRAPCERLLDTHAARGQQAHGYLFDWPARHRRLRACHAIELGFLFGWRDRGFHGDGPAAERLEAAMQRAWTAFAWDGRPHAASLGDWSARHPDAPATMRLGAAPGVADDGWAARAAFWDTLEDDRLGAA